MFAGRIFSEDILKSAALHAMRRCLRKPAPVGS
jgi:hypothetical protein